MYQHFTEFKLHRHSFVEQSLHLHDWNIGGGDIGGDIDGDIGGDIYGDIYGDIDGDNGGDIGEI